MFHQILHMLYVLLVVDVSCVLCYRDPSLSAFIWGTSLQCYRMHWSLLVNSVALKPNYEFLSIEVLCRAQSCITNRHSYFLLGCIECVRCKSGSYTPDVVLRLCYVQYLQNYSIKQWKYPLSSNGKSVLAHRPFRSPSRPSSVLCRLSTPSVWPAVSTIVTAHPTTAHSSSQAAPRQSQ